MMDPDDGGQPRMPDTPALVAWKRKMWRACFVLMPLGLLMMIVGAATAWGSTAMTGFIIGGVGMFMLVVGALCGKFAMAGPYPGGLR